MSEPASPNPPADELDAALQEFAGVARRLQDETEAVNNRIARCEQVLVALNPGFPMFGADLHMTPIQDNLANGADFLFTKHQDEWGLWIRRGKFRKVEGTWRFVPDDAASKILPLLDGTRSERATANAYLKKLVEDITAKARLSLEELGAALKKKSER